MEEHEAERRRAAWRYLWRLIVREHRGVLGAITGGLIWQGAAVMTPLVVERAIDRGIVPENHQALLLWCGGLLLLGLIEASAGGMRHFFAIRNRANADAAVRDALFTRALELDARFHDRVGAGELMSRASNDAELIARLLDAAGHTVAYVLTVVAVSVILLTIDLPLALIVLLPLPLVSIGFWRYSSRYGGTTRRLQEELGNATALAEETIAGIRVAKGLGAGDALNARFRVASDRVVDRALDVARVDAVFLPALEALPLLGILATLWFGTQRVVDGELTLGQLAAFNLYLAILVWPLRTLGQRVQTVQQAVAAAMRITEVLESEPAVVEPASPKRLAQRGAADVAFEDVVFGYEPRRPVLDGFSLEIRCGQLRGARRRHRLRQDDCCSRCSRASTTRSSAAWSSTASTSASCGSTTSATRSGSCSRTRSSSRTPSPRTSRSHVPKPLAARSSPRRGSAVRTSSSARSRSATTPCSASAATRSPAASASGSRSRARSWPIPRC